MRLISPTDIWRIVKDVDVEGIAHAAQRRVPLLVASEDGDDAARFCAWLAYDAVTDDGGVPEPHPWLTALAAVEGLPALPEAPAAAVLVGREPLPGPGTGALRDHLARHGVPLVTVSLEAAHTRSETGRVWIASLDDGASEAVAAALLPLVPKEDHVALARAFPRLRVAVSTALVEQTAKANASYAFTTGLAESVPVLTAPIAVGDMVILTKNQLLMCYRIVLAHGRDGTPRELLGEIVSVLGSGLLLRQAARQLVGLLPVVGLLPKVAVAYAGTWAIGRAMIAWAGEGREVAASTLKRYTREGLGRGRVVARALLDASRSGMSRTSARLRRSREPGA